MSTMRIDDIDTPAPVVDLDRVERNLKRAADYFAEKKIALRPHIKTHKIVEFSRRQVELGAVGITCQKLGEAEVMADGGITDILMTFPIVGEAKLKRLTALAKRIRMSAVTDFDRGRRCDGSRGKRSGREDRASRRVRHRHRALRRAERR